MERTVKEVHGSLQVTLPKELARQSGISKGMRLTFEPQDSGILLRNSASSERIMWTIGYEGQTLDSFVAELGRHGIQHLVDVRELPLSRRRGFSKSPLAAALESAGITYSHMRALGAPKPVRKPFIEGGSFAVFRNGYLSHLGKTSASLDELEGHVKTSRTAIMCVEKVHSVCHRQFVAQSLAERGYEIRHLQPMSRA